MSTGWWKIDSYRTHVSVHQVAGDAEVVLEILGKEHDVALTITDYLFLKIIRYRTKELTSTNTQMAF